MKAGTQNHLKTKRLKRLLQRPLYQVVGVLETLWLLCADCCDEGNIGKFTDEEIADYLEWDGDPSALVRSLSDSGWTDTDETGRPVIHDWLEHCPEYIRDRVRKRLARATKVGVSGRGITTCASSTPDTPGQAPDKPPLRPSIPNPTNPNQSQPLPRLDAAGTEIVSESKPAKSGYTAAFEAWYAVYPRKVGKQGASAAYGRAIGRIASARSLSKTDAHLWLLQATSQFAASPAGNAGTYTPHPAAWLNQGRYDDDPSEWHTKANGTPSKPRPPTGPPPEVQHRVTPHRIVT